MSAQADCIIVASDVRLLAAARAEAFEPLDPASVPIDDIDTQVAMLALR